MKKIMIAVLLIASSASALADGQQIQRGFPEYKVTKPQVPASKAKECPIKMDFMQQQISDAFVQYDGSRLTAEDFCKNGTIAQIAFMMKMAAREGRSYKGMKVNPNSSTGSSGALDSHCARATQSGCNCSSSR